MLTYLEARAIAGIEEVVGVYRRTVCEGAAFGIVAVGHDPARHSLIVTVTFPSVRALPAILTRVRRVFDVGADIETIGAHLSRDPLLAPLVASRPGLRAPGGWDGFELAVRAVLGQQVAVAAATDYLKIFLASLRGILGGEIASYRSLMTRARREAVLRLIEQAQAKGYNALSNLRLHGADVGGSALRTGTAMVCILASATAYHATARTRLHPYRSPG